MKRAPVAPAVSLDGKRAAEWIDDSGSVNFSDNPEHVPAKYRSRVKVRESMPAETVEKGEMQKEKRPVQAEPSRRSAPDLFGGKPLEPARVQDYAEAIREARATNLPLGGRVIRADDLMPNKDWGVLASIGYMCDDPYTGVKGVTQVRDGVYRVSTRLATRNASSVITFTFRLMEPLAETKLIFSPLLSRFLEGIDPATRPVKVSDSGRIRNELQTMLSQALEHDGDTIRVHFDRLDEKVVPREKQETIRKVLTWYRTNHPVWFGWLEIA